MLDFRRITLLCLDKRLSQHKMHIFYKHLEGAKAPLPPWLRLCFLNGSRNLYLLTTWSIAFRTAKKYPPLFFFLRLVKKLMKQDLQLNGSIELTLALLTPFQCLFFTEGFHSVLSLHKVDGNRSVFYLKKATVTLKPSSNNHIILDVCILSECFRMRFCIELFRFSAIISKKVSIPSHCNGPRNICLLLFFPYQQSFQPTFSGRWHAVSLKECCW